MKLEWEADEYGAHTATVNKNAFWQVCDSGIKGFNIYAALFVSGHSKSFLEKEGMNHIQNAKNYAQRLTDKLWPDES